MQCTRFDAMRGEELVAYRKAHGITGGQELDEARARLARNRQELDAEREQLAMERNRLKEAKPMKETRKHRVQLVVTESLFDAMQQEQE